MADLGSQVYNLQMQEMVTLWIVDFRPSVHFNNSSEGIMYVTSYKDGTGDIVYDGETYGYVGITSGGFSSEINGSLPEPTVTFDKVSLENQLTYRVARQEHKLQTKQVFFGWEGAEVTRIRTTSDYLGSTANSTIDYFVVSQLLRTNKDTIELKLAVSEGVDRLNSVSVQELAPNQCNLVYRRYNGTTFDYISHGCPYGNPSSTTDWSAVPDYGIKYYTYLDAATTADLDQCSYTVKGCQLRFDPDKDGLTLPYTGLYSSR